MSYLHNGSTLEHNSNWFGKLKWRPTTFVFFSIFRNWSCDQPPNNPWTLTHRIIMIVYFLPFWSYISFWSSGYNILVTIFGNVHRPCRHHFMIVNNSLYHVYSFVPIFWLYLHQLPYWEMHTDHVSNASTLSYRVYILSIFFSWVFLIFLLCFYELLY